MTELYLNGHRVYFDDSQSLKVTRENPLVTKSGAFTLNVVLPMDIKENVEVLGMIHRIDVKRTYTTFSCILLAEGRTVLDGTAVVTTATEDAVKVQLLSGNSEVSFWDKAKKVYIDNIDFEQWNPDSVKWMSRWIMAYGRKEGEYRTYSPRGVIDIDAILVEPGKWNTIGLPGVGVFMPVYDETNGVIRNDHTLCGEYDIHVHDDALQPNFMMVLSTVVRQMGYSLNENNLDVPWLKSMYIASARIGSNIANALPHWTVKEFIEHAQDFLNCSFVFDDIKKTVSIVENSHFTNMVNITDCIVGEFSAEYVSDDDVDQNIVSSNIAYADRGGMNDIDMVDVDVIEAFENVEYPSLNDVSIDAVDGRDPYKIYVTPEGKFVYDDGVYRKIDHFGALSKDKENVDDRYELKIVPCRTILEEFMIEGENIIVRYYALATKLSITNQFQAAENESAWTAICDNNVDKGTEKEDIMQVFLIDDKLLTSPIIRGESSVNMVKPDDNRIGKMVFYPMPFTERGLNMPDSCTQSHEDWSLALAHCSCSKFHGSRFLDGVKQDNNVELVVSFYTKSIPCVTDLYFIKGKKYRCKKIEMTFSSEGMDRVVKGYFSELDY